MLNKITKENICIALSGSKSVFHIFNTVNWTAPSMDEKCKLSISAAIGTSPDFALDSLTGIFDTIEFIPK